MEDENSKIFLCYSMEYTINDYNEDLEKGNKDRIAEFFYNRFNERYIEPFEENEKKNGFSMMAVACLMIEALECFDQGLKETPRKKGKQFFENFFFRCDDLADFRGLGFYKHIRCGILHQAETTGGWKISRRGEIPLLNKSTKTINATKFLEQLKKYLINYRKKLEKEGFNGPIWLKFKKKMNTIIKNCQVKNK